jgi:nucleoside-diphosphate-sugar epimerase
MREFTLVTGATGLIGSHVVSKLRERRREVVAVVRREADGEKRKTLERLGAVIAEGLFYDQDVLEKIFNAFDIENVIHCAALRGGGAGSREEYQTVNVDGTETLLRASLHGSVKRFIYLSSVGVLGTIPKELPGSLQSSLDGDNKYHESKVLAEGKVREYIGGGLDACILRPTITYGRGDNGFPTKLVEMVKKHQLLLPLHDITIHLLDADTLADMTARILDASEVGQNTFIVGDREPVSLRELTDTIHRHFYGTSYPAFLRFPNPGYEAMLSASRLMRLEKWITRILLLTRSWYYDVEPAVHSGFFRPANTGSAFLRVMCS